MCEWEMYSADGANVGMFSVVEYNVREVEGMKGDDN